MRAIQIGSGEGLERLQIVSFDPPEPRPSEIAVRITASSQYFADYAHCVGMIPLPVGRVPLVDGAGVAIAVGSDVHEFTPGDQVVGVFYPDWPSATNVAAANQTEPSS